jgi:hypothetical protein
MPRAKKSVAPVISDFQLREAIAALQPPTEELLVDKPMRTASRQIQRILSGGKSKVSTATELKAVLADLASAGKAVPVLKGPGLSGAGIIGQIPPISQVMSGLYLPVDTPDILVPPARRYFAARVTPPGNGYAYAESGKLSALQVVDLASADAASWAEFSILFSTNRSAHGSLSEITFQVDIAWRAVHMFSSDPVWSQRLDGYVWLKSYVYLDVNRFDPTSGSFVPITANKSRLLESTWYVNEGGESANSGTLINGAAATLQFRSSPPQTFVLRTLLLAQADHNVRNVDGQPIAPPQSGQFVAYALTNADVPDMLVTYRVLSS